jgi:hypothetical protein
LRRETKFANSPRLTKTTTTTKKTQVQYKMIKSDTTKTKRLIKDYSKEPYADK